MILSELYLYSSLMLIAFVCLWTIVSYPKNYIFKALFIPFLIFIVISLFQTYYSILGYATDEEIKENLQYYHHISENDVIYILMSSSKGEPRLYKILNTEQAEKELDKMRQKVQSGITVYGKFERLVNPNSNEINLGEYRVYDMPFQKLVPKEED